jgi:hypothetical protein
MVLDPAMPSRRRRAIRRPCPRCGSTWDPRRLADLLALREAALHLGDSDTVAIIDAELWTMGISPPANDN